MMANPRRQPAASFHTPPPGYPFSFSDNPWSCSAMAPFFRVEAAADHLRNADRHPFCTRAPRGRPESTPARLSPAGLSPASPPPPVPAPALREPIKK